MRKMVAVSLAAIILMSAAPYAISAQTSVNLDEIVKRFNESAPTDQDLEQVAKLIAEQPQNGKAHYVMGLLLERKGFEQLALESYTGAVKYQPDIADAHHRRCLLLVADGNWNDAMKEIEVCEKLFKNNGQLLFELGTVVERAHKQDVADRLYALAGNAVNQGKGAGYNVARLRFAQGRFKEALAALDTDLKKDPHGASANLMKGEILFEMKRGDEAIEAYVIAADTAPCEERAAERVADHLYDARRYPQALRFSLLNLLCPMQRDPIEIERIKTRVISIMHQIPDDHSYDVIHALYGLAARSNNCRFFHLFMGDVYDRLNRPYRAIQHYQTGCYKCRAPLSDDKQLARGLFRLGQDYEVGLKNYHEALTLYERAASLYPEDKQIQMAYRRLKRRLPNRRNDFAWRLKDAFFSPKHAPPKI